MCGVYGQKNFHPTIVILTIALGAPVTIVLKNWRVSVIDWSKYTIYFQEFCAGSVEFETQEEADAYYKIWKEGFDYAASEYY